MWNKSSSIIVEILPKLWRKILVRQFNVYGNLNIFEKKMIVMKKFKFTSKRSKEAIGSTDAYTISEAIIFFANLKRLDIETFLEIYSVEEVK